MTTDPTQVDPEPSQDDISELEAAKHAYPWKPVPDWVTWSPIGDGAYRRYCKIHSLTTDYRIWYRSAKLAQLLGISEKTLHRDMKTLVDHGMMLKKTRRDTKGRRVSTVYKLLVEPAEIPPWPINGAQARNNTTSNK